MSKSVKPSGLSQNHPLALRKTVNTLHNQEGEIVKLDGVNYGIQSSAESMVLLPVNLPQNFQKQGIKILFSGMTKEIGLNEMMAGQPIVLTDIHKK